MRRLAVSTIAVLVALTVSASLAFADWPTTCVEANDAFERNAGRHHNVGIYQRVHGAGAEAACQGDHRSRIQSAFWWAFRDVVQVPPPAPVAPPPVYEPPVATSGPQIDAGLDSAWDALRSSHFGSELLRVRGAERVVEIIWAYDLPSHALAGWAPNTGAIGISPSLRSESTIALATLIAHEFWHAVSPIPDDSGFNNCIAEEVRAFITQSAVWMDLRPAIPRAGTALEQAHERAMEIWLNDPGDLPGRMVLEDVSGYPGLRNLALYIYDYATICVA